MRRSGGVMSALTLVLALALPQGTIAAPAGSTLLVSRPDGQGAVPPALDNDSSTPGGLSANGRYAVYTSQADGFAEGIDPFVTSVLLRDAQTGSTTLVSRSDGLDGAAADGDSSHPVVAVDADGHVLVAFEVSFAANLVDHASGAMVPAGDEIWLRDVTAGTTTLVSRPDGTAPIPAGGSNVDPAITISALGPVVAFASNASNIGGSGGIFLRTVDADDTQLVSCHANNCAGADPEGEQGVLDAPDVRAVPATTPGTTTCPSTGGVTECVLMAFGTLDTSITNEPPGTTHEQVVETVSKLTGAEAGVPPPASLYIVSRPDLGPTSYGNGDSFSPSFDADGRYVAFRSSATNLTADTPLPTGGTREAYVRDVFNDRTAMLSKAPDPANGEVRSVVLGGSTGSLRAVFSATVTNLGVSSPGNQVYLRDVATGVTSLLDRASGATGTPGDGGGADSPAISADGSTALFASRSDDLGDEAGGRFQRVHARTLPADPNADAGVVSLVSRPSGSAPFASLTDQSSIAFSAVSSNGRFVAFSSQSDSLSSEDDNRFTNIFVRDMLTGTDTLVSRAGGAGGAAVDANATVDGISDNGRRVVFDSAADNLATGVPAGVDEVYVRDLDADTTTLVSRANGEGGSAATSMAFSARISANGNVVGFLTESTLDPAATAGHLHAYVRDLGAHTTTLVDRDTGSGGAVPAFDAISVVPDANGGRVAFSSAGALAGAPADGKYRVFVRDLAGSTTTLVSRAEGPTGVASDGRSVYPAIDADGNVVAFLSSADNLAGPQTEEQDYVRDLGRAHTELVSRASGAAGTVSYSAELPTIDGAGDRVAFAGDFPEIHNAASFEAFVRDLPSQTTTLASAANASSDVPADARVDEISIDSSGDCLAFQSAATNLGDGFASADFSEVHLRVLRNECPLATPAGTGSGGGTGTTAATPAGGAGAAVAARAVLLTQLALRSRRFRVGGKAAGTKISFTLSGASKVTLVFRRLEAGRLLRRRCLKSARKGRRCVIARSVGSLTVKGEAGANALAFNGRLGRHTLSRGSYRLTATPASGVAHSVTFTVVSRAGR